MAGTDGSRWDTLFYGERKLIDEEGSESLRTVHRRPPEIFYANRELVRSELVAASGHVNFGIDVGNVGMETGIGPMPLERDRDGLHYHGFTTRQDVWGSTPVEVNLSINMFKPFLRKNLTVC